MADEKGRESHEIEVPFVFVRHGDLLPVDWMARHPGWVRFPATLVPRPVPRRVVPGTAWDIAGTSEPGGFGPMSRPVSVGAPVVRRRRVPVHRLPTGQRDAEDPVAAFLRVSKVMDGAAPTYLAAERARGAAPKTSSTGTEGLTSSLAVAATAGSAAGGTAQAGVFGMVDGLAASNAGKLWDGTGVLDIAGAGMASPGLVGSATSTGVSTPMRGLDIADQVDQYKTPDGHIHEKKITRQMIRRGWTEKLIDDAVQNGWRIDATNKGTGGPATRYVSPSTGQSTVIDNTTNEILQTAGPGFEFGPESGDVPGAQMRPPPSVPQSEINTAPDPSPIIAPEPVPMTPEIPEVPLIEPFL